MPNVDIDRERIIRILGYLGYLNNDMNVFDQLPAEVLSNLLLYLDCKSILLICKLSGKFSKFCEINLVNLLKENLHTMTRLNTNKYNRQQLTNLCHVSYPKYKNISAGDHHSLISIDRQVYACGFNGSGQLGLGDNISTNVTKLITKLPHDVTRMSAGKDHSLFLGSNSKGQLELEDFENINIPRLIPGIVDIIDISAGTDCSLILTDKGQVYGLGNNMFGQLGIGDVYKTDIPILIQELNSIISISLKLLHSMFLTNTYSVYVCGWNTDGNLGLGDTKHTDIPKLIPQFNNIIQVSAGYNHSLILTNDGDVYSFGHGGSGQLGLGSSSNKNVPTLIPNLDPVIQISAGFHFSLVLSINNQVHIFGYMLDTFIKYKPELIMGNVIQISAGYYHYLLITAKGVYASGNNSNGQLGLGDNETRDTPTLVMSLD